MGDMLDYIDWRALECLNQNPKSPVTNALKQGYRDDDALLLESDTDEQLLIHIPFNQAVKLSAISIRSAGTGGAAPRRVKLFVNRPTLGFSEATDFAGVAEFELTPEQLDGASLPLKFAKFQNVNTLTVFIEDNQGDEDVTRVQKITLTGTGGETFNVADIKKVGEDGKPVG